MPSANVGGIVVPVDKRENCQPKSPGIEPTGNGNGIYVAADGVKTKRTETPRVHDRLPQIWNAVPLPKPNTRVDPGLSKKKIKYAVSFVFAVQDVSFHVNSA